MRQVYVASHGPFAQGVVDSLALLIGEDHGVMPICAYCGEITTTDQLEALLEKIAVQGAGQEIVIFTDVMGGSVNNSAAKTVMRHPHVYVVSGVNLTLLLEFLLCEETSTEAAIGYAIRHARQGITYINALIGNEGAQHDQTGTN